MTSICFDSKVILGVAAVWQLSGLYHKPPVLAWFSESSHSHSAGKNILPIVGQKPQLAQAVKRLHSQQGKPRYAGAEPGLLPGEEMRTHLAEVLKKELSPEPQLVKEESGAAGASLSCIIILSCLKSDLSLQEPADSCRQRFRCWWAQVCWCTHFLPPIFFNQFVYSS